MKDDNIKKAVELLNDRKILSQAYLMRKCRFSSREAHRVIQELKAWGNYDKGIQKET
jgi:biotin operon repressor